jgi:hypothetical protein
MTKNPVSVRYHGNRMGSQLNVAAEKVLFYSTSYPATTKLRTDSYAAIYLYYTTSHRPSTFSRFGHFFRT